MTSKTETAEDPRSTRQWTRSKHVCLAWIESLEGTFATQKGIARVMNVSSRGVGLVLADDYPLDAPVLVDLLVLGSLRLRARGRVAHSRPSDSGQFRVGVEFIESPVLVDQDEVPKEKR